MYSARNLATLLSAVTWKVGKVPNELNDLAEEISKQNGGSTVWFFLDIFHKTQEESGKLRKNY